MMTAEMRLLERSMIHWDTQEIIGAGKKTNVRKNSSILIPDDIVPVLQDVASQATGELLFPMGEEDFYDVYYKALTDAGVTRHLSPYSCRHTTATALTVNANIAPQTVQRIMRWSSTKMMDRYVHPGETDARTAINRL
jgi:integrase